MCKHRHRRAVRPHLRSILRPVGRPILRTILWSLLCVLPGTPLLAQDATLPDEDAYLYQPPVVLSASRLDQPLNEAPVTLTIIDRAMIEASGARTLPELFRLVPGFQVAMVRGHEQVVAYHGLTGEYGKNMQVLIDGRSVYSLISFGGVDWFTLPYSLDDIERIEVVQGSNSAAYGANAFLGVANIITRKAADHPAVRLSGAAGHHNIRDGSLQLSTTGERLGLRATLGRRGDDGLDIFQDDRSLSRYLNARLEWSPSGQDEITVYLGGQEGRRAQGTGTDGDTTRTQTADSGFAHLRWRHTWSPNAEVAMQYYRNYDYLFERQFYDIPVLGQRVFDVTVTAHREHAEFQHIFAAGPRTRVVWGLEGRRDEARSAFFFGTNETRRTDLMRVFGNLEWRARPDTVVNLGATSEHNDLTGTHNAPRLSLSHHVTPAHTLRYAYTSAFLTPTLGESLGEARFVTDGILLAINFRGNPALRPARLQTHELGYMGEVQSLGISLNARLFHEKITGLFVENRVPIAPEVAALDDTTRTLSNQQNANLRGLEYQARVSLGSLGSLVFNHAFIDIDTPLPSYAGGDSYDRSAPMRSFTALLDTRLPASLRLGLIWSRVSDMQWLGFGGQQPSRSTLDIRLARDFRWTAGSAQFALVARNALDKSYSEFRPENQINPRYYATFTTSF